MPAPDDYTFLKVPDPTETVNKNIQMAINVSQAQQQQQMHQLQMQQAQNQLARQQAMREGFTKLAQNPTGENITAYGLQFPEVATQMKELHGLHSDDDKRAIISHGLQMRNAIMSGSPATALDLAGKWHEMYKGKGDDANAQSMDSLIKTMKADPLHASAAIGSYMAGADPEKFAENEKVLTTTKAYQDTQAALADQERAKATKLQYQAIYAPLTSNAEARDVTATADKNQGTVKPTIDAAVAGAGSAESKQVVDKVAAGNAQHKTELENAGMQIANDVKAAGGGALDIRKFNEMELPKLNYEINGLTPADREQATKYRDAGVEGMNSGQRLTLLANKVAGSKDDAGMGEALNQFYRAKAGTETGKDMLQYELNDLRAKTLLAGVKSGRMPEALLEMLQGNAPGKNASRQVLVPYIQKLAAITALQGKIDTLSSYWSTYSPKDPVNAQRDFDINSLGIHVKRGQPFAEVQSSFAPKDMRLPGTSDKPENNPVPGGGQQSAKYDPQQIYHTLRYLEHAGGDPKLKKAYGDKLTALGINIKTPSAVFRSREMDKGNVF